MIELVTIDEAREHLRLDYDDTGGPDDPWLEVMIPAISEAVALWLKEPSRLYVPDTDDAVVRPSVRAAVLIELASAMRFREGEGKDNTVPADAGHGYVLNKVSTALLAPLRRPTVG